MLPTAYCFHNGLQPGRHPCAPCRLEAVSTRPNRPCRGYVSITASFRMAGGKSRRPARGRRLQRQKRFASPVGPILQGFCQVVKLAFGGKIERLPTNVVSSVATLTLHFGISAITRCAAPKRLAFLNACSLRWLAGKTPLKLCVVFSHQPTRRPDTIAQRN